jgi:hypothetical protein
MNMKKLASVIFGVLLISSINVSASNAGSYCNNGSYSLNSGRGTCSYNGGINKNFPSYSDPGSSSFNRNNGLGSSLNDSLGSGLGSYGSSRNKNSFGTGLGSSLNDPYSSWGSTSKKKSRW